MSFDVKTKQRVARTLVTTAAALMLAACGGGGGGEPAAQSSLQLSGTAATGLALASAQVDIKCATGTGSATTNASGAYTASIAGAALPCIIRVTGEAGGAAIVLHSVAEAGTTANSVTSATANVTPLTEIIVAQLTAALPSVMFEGFGSGSTVTSAQLTAATAAVLSTLRDAAGIDLGSIDPFKTTLVAATTANPTAGNDYDKLLDALGEKVSVEALPIIVSQIASAATSGSSTALTDVMTGVGAGALENCPVAMSGKYRTISYTGETQVHVLDFKAKTMTTGSEVLPITPSTTQACEFAVGDAIVVVGASGAGAFRGSDMNGVFFPVQAHAMASVTGTWTFLESGINEDNVGEHFFGKMEVAADGKVTVCDYNVMGGIANFGTCTADDETANLTAASDGGFSLSYGDTPSRIFGYRAPDGSLTLFGTNNPTGSSEPTDFRTSFVMTRPAALQLPAMGQATAYWDTSIVFNDSTHVLMSDSLFRDSTTVTAVDAAAGSFTRTRGSDSRVDTFEVNKPVEGLRYRAGSTGISSIYQMQVPSLRMAFVIDDMSDKHIYGISVTRP